MRRLLLLAVLLSSTAAHAQWTIEDAHTTADLRGIHSIGNGIAWASGTNGTVVRTTDDGITWQTCTTPPDAEKLDFHSIQAFDANTAIVMSSGKSSLSRIYKTTDACKSWHLVLTHSNPDGFWDVLRFERTKNPGHAHGVLVGDAVDGAFVVYKTYDSGDTWHDAAFTTGWHSAKAREGELLFASSNSAVSFDGILAFVTGGNGGARFLQQQHYGLCDCIQDHFHSITLPMSSGPTSGASSLASRMSHKYDLDYMAVGGDVEKPDSPGASAFIPSHAPAAAMFVRGAIPPHTPPHGFRSAVAYDEKSKTWITVGPNGTDISTDDGRNWRALKPSADDAPDADKNWNALSLPFVVGPHGRIGKLRQDALSGK